MKIYSLILVQIFLATLAFCQNTAKYFVEPIPFTKVQLSDRFWAPRLETVRTTTLPYALKMCRETGRVKNFELASGATGGAFCTTYPFDDSDVYKIIEGASYSLQVHPDPRLDAEIDELIAKIAAAQEQDGYLYSWRTIFEKNPDRRSEDASKERGIRMAGEQRWMLTDQHSHELYNAGHLYEAAVAHHLATGKRNLLDVALKNADLVERTFGKGKLEKAPGHQEIEIGLVKLYLLSGEKRFLDLAKFFLDVRGYGDAYQQNHQKVTEQSEAVGHAVRACYMYAGMADVAALTGEQPYVSSLYNLWNDVTGKKMYVTGGIGSSGSNEGFSAAFDLPNYSAYCETCSSIAFILWNQRMFALTGQGKYIDVLERTLYNALNAGLSLSGDRFFYPNPLESRKNVERSPWFACACCPSNVARFFPSLPGYVYAKAGNNLYVNLFATSKTTVRNVNSRLQFVDVAIAQTTNYPWDGTVRISIEPAKPHTFALKIRIPGWARGDAVPGNLYSFQDKKENNIFLKINGMTTLPDIRNGYAVLERKWKAGDVVELTLPMPVRWVVASPLVDADAYKVAFQRGPLMYCLEGKDQPDERVLNVLVPPTAEINTSFQAGFLGGVQTLSFDGFLVKDLRNQEVTAMRLKAIPYFAWANRGLDNMIVWLPYDLRSARAISQPTIASKSKLSASEGVKGDLISVNDQNQPSNSVSYDNPFVHWWPRFGTTEWLQYDFEKPEQVGTVRVYWFDDEEIGGGCRTPASWRVLYLENGEWKPVYVPAGYMVTKNGWDEVQFEPVQTQALRLELTSKQGVSAGVLEWEVR
jgi:hypothetical protein